MHLQRSARYFETRRVSRFIGCVARIRNTRRISFSPYCVPFLFLYLFTTLLTNQFYETKFSRNPSHNKLRAPRTRPRAPPRSRTKTSFTSHRTLVCAHTCAMTNNRVSAISIPHAGSRIWPSALWMPRRVDYTRLRVDKQYRIKYVRTNTNYFASFAIFVLFRVESLQLFTF